MDSDYLSQEMITVTGDILPPGLEQSLETIGESTSVVKEVVFTPNSVILKTVSGDKEIKDSGRMALVTEGIVRDLFEFGDYGFDSDEAKVIAKDESDLRNAVKVIRQYDLFETRSGIIAAVRDLEKMSLRDTIFKFRDYLRSEEGKKKELLAYVLSFALGKNMTLEETKEAYGAKTVNQLLRNHSYGELQGMSKYLESLPGARRYTVGVQDGKIMGFVPSRNPQIKIEKNKSFSSVF